MKLVNEIALRHLRSKKKGSFSGFAGMLSIVGLAIGVTALVITVAILEGFEMTLSDKISGFDGHLRIQHFLDQPIDLPAPRIDSILAKLDPVYQSIDYIQKPVIIRHGTMAEGIIIEGVSSLDVGQGPRSIIREGDKELQNGSIIIGERLATDLQLDLGDKVVLFDLSQVGDISTAQRIQQFTLSGLFHSGLLEYDKTIAFITLSDAQSLFNMEEKITGKMFFFENNEEFQRSYDIINRDISYPYYALSWKEKHSILFQWIALQRWPIIIIFGLIALVGVVNIISAITMIILEKTQEIGILKSMGFSHRNLQKIFFIEGTLIGGIGSLLGVLVAVIIVWIQQNFQIISIPEDVYFMDHIPVEINWTVTIIIFFCGLLASLVAALWPSRRARNISPVDALRYE